MFFVVTGPSGSGKSTLARRALAEVEGLEFSVSHTTRPKRDAEQEGKDYYFVSKKDFEDMIREEKFLEWAVVHGYHYGTSRREVEKRSGKKDLIFDIDVQGARKIKEAVKKAVFIFILPPDFKELKKRLGRRGQDDAAVIQKRLDTAKKEIREYHKFDYIIINDSLDLAVKDLVSIILGTRCRFENRLKEIVPILRSFTGEG